MRHTEDPVEKAEESGVKLPAHERWQAQRKNYLDKKAIAMIENRMQQEANELQLMEGWHAASRNSIRDKFVDTRHRNSVTERHMDFIHTRDRLAPGLGGEEGHDFSQTSPAEQFGYAEAPEEEVLLDADFTATSTSLPEVSAAVLAQQPPERDTESREATKTERSRISGSMFPDVAMSREERDELSYVEESLDEMDDFTSTIPERQVRTSQRLRSLTIDSTKSWTRPMPKLN